ncbi:hypothetical protein Tco_1300297, partial [Tanacetum coccineum]
KHVTQVQSCKDKPEFEAPLKAESSQAKVDECEPKHAKQAAQSNHSIHFQQKNTLPLICMILTGEELISQW